MNSEDRTPKKDSIVRRSFIKKAAVGTAGAFVLPRFSIGKPGPSANSKLNIAMIGCGDIVGMAFSELRDENIIALCDVDKQAKERKSFRKKSGDAANAPFYQDYRVMLDKIGKEIDGVCINTPDHMHFAPTIDAMERGIHVCCQKPLTHDVWQARTLVKAKEKYGVITNMANQGHTYSGIRRMRDWVEHGVFGQIKEVHMGIAGPGWGKKYFKKPAVPMTEDPVPDSLNWDLWLGSKPDVPFNNAYHPLTWRGFYEYGQGTLGDWFPHIGDGPVWGLELYEPTVIECVERGPISMDGLVPDHSVIRWDFPARGDKAPCSAFWYSGSVNGGKAPKVPDEWDLGKASNMGSYWYGERQNGYLDHRSNNPRLSTRQAMMDFNKGEDVPVKYEPLPRSIKGPFNEWAAVIKGNLAGKCGSNFDYSARLTEVACLGGIAQRFGGRLEWDAKRGLITNRPELNAFVKQSVRPGWDRGVDLWA